MMEDSALGPHGQRNALLAIAVGGGIARKAETKLSALPDAAMNGNRAPMGIEYLTHDI